MKRMLINATHSEELRVAIVDGQRLVDLDIEHKSREQRKSNIYKAKITRVEPSLEAVFVDYGGDRHGFLPFKEIAKEYHQKNNKKSEGGRANIRDVIKEGQEIVVQIEKEERSNKGAALTTYISLAGRFLVLMPNNARAGGVSRRIEGEERSELKAAMNDVEVPDGMGTIVRTAGIGRTTEELQWDLDYQAAIWKAIQDSASERKAPFLIYQESNIIVRGLRDYFRGDIGEIIADEPGTHAQAADFIKLYMPQNERKLKLYQDDVPLFNRYQVESQIETAFRREVSLPSGGALVIDHTEALISIDINSARATKGSDIEETATNTNLEAADEVARQLRLRDLGGLVVIDFIDMMASKHQRAVENRLRDALKQDRARVQVGRISKFGLLEMSRQRLRPSLGESSENVCPRCHGHGTIRGIESTALSILRLVEEEAMKDNTGKVLADVPVEVATYLLNEKRQSINEIEARNQCTLLIVANPSIQTPNYTIERIRSSDGDHDSDLKKSYELAVDTTENYTPQTAHDAKKPEAAAVSTVTPLAPAPSPANRNVQQAPAAEAGRSSGGLFGIFGAVTSLFGAGSSSSTDPQTGKAEQAPTADSNQSRQSKKADSETGRNRNRNNKRASNSGRGRGKGRNSADTSEHPPEVNAEGRSEGRGGNRSNSRRGRGKSENKEAGNQSARSTRDASDTNDQNTASTTEEQSGTARNPRSRGRGRGRKTEKNEVRDTTVNTTADGEVEKLDGSQGEKAQDTANEESGSGGTRSRGRRGGRRRGGRGRNRNTESSETTENVDTTQTANDQGVMAQTERTETAPADVAPVTEDKPSASTKASNSSAAPASEGGDSSKKPDSSQTTAPLSDNATQPASGDTKVQPASEQSASGDTKVQPASAQSASDVSKVQPATEQSASDDTKVQPASEQSAQAEQPAEKSSGETATRKPRPARKPRVAKKVESANARAASEGVAADKSVTGERAADSEKTASSVVSATSSSASASVAEPANQQSPSTSAIQSIASEKTQDAATLSTADAPTTSASQEQANATSTKSPDSASSKRAKSDGASKAASDDSNTAAEQIDASTANKRHSSSKRREKARSKKTATAQASTSQSDEGAGQTVAKETPEPASSDTTPNDNQEAKVSQRQPSQLKSTVRSLANKDNGSSAAGRSFASKKVADVDTKTNSGKQKDESASTSTTDDSGNMA